METVYEYSKLKTKKQTYCNEISSQVVGELSAKSSVAILPLKLEAPLSWQ